MFIAINRFFCRLSGHDYQLPQDNDVSFADPCPPCRCVRCGEELPWDKVKVDKLTRVVDVIKLIKCTK